MSGFVCLAQKGITARFATTRQSRTKMVTGHHSALILISSCQPAGKLEPPSGCNLANQANIPRAILQLARNVSPAKSALRLQTNLCSVEKASNPKTMLLRQTGSLLAFHAAKISITMRRPKSAQPYQQERALFIRCSPSTSASLESTQTQQALL